MSGTNFDPGLTTKFGGRLRRTINDDGSFNVERRGLSRFDGGVYLYLKNASWPLYLGVMAVLFILANLIFASIYTALGPEHLAGVDESTEFGGFLGAFFFSVQTMTTVGYGHIAPKTTLVSFVAALEAMLGLLGFAIATGMMYARFSKPSARLMFSDCILVAPYQGGGMSLQFRVANRRPNILMELEARVLLMSVENSNGQLRRDYKDLPLEIPKIYFLPLTWTVVHKIDEKSPLFGKTAEDLESCQAEFLILIKAFDDTFGQDVHSRHSYTFEEMRWNAKFDPAFSVTQTGSLMLDMNEIHRHQIMAGKDSASEKQS